ncbi:MAG: enoyl-CoA hydratase/isomerase family protein, partial [Polyangiaceae bacterium]
MLDVLLLQKIKIAKSGHFYRISLNYPERRNAIGPQMTNELLHALADAHASPETRVVILEGEGKSFCAGGDFQQMTSGGDGPTLEFKGDYADLLLAMVRSEKPIICKIHGHALGGGLGLVAASTFAIASEDAQLGTPEIDVGLFPMMIMAVLTRLVPRRKLLEMMLLGQKMPAPHALSLGILNATSPPEKLEQAILDLAQSIEKKAPKTTALGLRAFAQQDDMDLENALPMLREKLGEVLATNDAREGLMAFLQKRTPVWTG